MTGRHPAGFGFGSATSSSSLIRTEGTCRRNGSAARCCVQVSEDYYYPLGSTPYSPQPPVSLPGGECIINKSNPINVQISWQRHRAMLAQNADGGVIIIIMATKTPPETPPPEAPLGTLNSLFYHHGMKVNALLYA